MQTSTSVEYIIDQDVQFKFIRVVLTLVLYILLRDILIPQPYLLDIVCLLVIRSIDLCVVSRVYKPSVFMSRSNIIVRAS